MAESNFAILTGVPSLRRDFYLADPSLVQPYNANPIVEGEWLTLNDKYQLLRGAAATDIAFPVHAERGRYDLQSIGKVPVILAGPYEAETTVIDTASLAIGSPLMVGAGAGAFTGKRGLLLAAGAGSLIVGWVSRIQGSKVRFIHQGFTKF